MDYSVILGIVITAIVIIVPFMLGARKAIASAVAKVQAQHGTKEQQIIAGINAAFKYIESNPQQDKQVINEVINLAKLMGVAIPAGVVALA